MNYVLIVLFSAVGIALALLGFSHQRGNGVLKISASAPSVDRDFWASMSKKIMKSYFVGALGAALAAVAVAIRMPIPAEIGCITFLASLVFSLAILCKKQDFHPCDETEKLLKKWKLIFLFASLGGLLLTQQVFQYFNTLIK